MNALLHPSETPPRREARGVAVALATALAYAVVGLVALQLAIPPTYAAPLYPSAGIALAAAMVWGRPAVAGVLLGSLIVNTWAASMRGPLDAAALAAPMCLGVGAALQAEAGRRLVARLCGTPAALSDPRDIVRFFALAVPLSCLVSATVATASFVALGLMPVQGVPALWWTWWAGDTLGVLIGAPIALTMMARPRPDWAPRRLSVGLPLLVITALLAAAIVQVARWDEQRVAGRFDRDARAAAAALQERLHEPLEALETMRSLYVGTGRLDDDRLRVAVSHWVTQEPALRAVGHSEWIVRAEAGVLEARRRAEGVAGFAVFDRADGRDTAGDSHRMVITQIEPAEGNRSALGLNQLSVPAARVAIEAARRTGTAAASAGFRLTQEPGDRTGLVVYEALYDGEPATADERLQRTRGLVFATVEPDRLVAAVRDAQPAYLRLCLVDTDARTERPLLAGPDECLQPPAGETFELVVAQTFAGRQWDIRVGAPRDAVPDEQRGSAFLFSLVALGAAALLGALLLAITGRTRRIEVAVDVRTAELQREVAERARAEAALREREHTLRAIFDTAPLGIVYTDLAGRILSPNAAFCALLGRDADALVGHTGEEFTHPDDAPGAALFAAMVRGEREHYRRVKRYLRPDGTPVHVQMNVALLRDAAGRPYRTVGVVEDIGEQLRRAQAERERDAAEAANRAKSDFVSRMSHELRTPLNAMLGFAQLLDLDRDPQLAPHQHAWASQIQRAGWHLLQMINDTLDLSRIESGVLRLQSEVLDLSELLPACAALVEPAARARQVTLDVQVAPQARAVVGDLTRVKQVLANLLSNAVKYNVDGGTVTVRTQAADGGLVDIEVADTGMGMTEEQLAHLFEPFNRLGRESSELEGTGIGLVISRRLAELMGGRLRVQSRTGTGSRFTLTLPHGDLAAVPASLTVAGEPLAVRYRRRHVHYVEDNATNAEVMRGILMQRPQVRLDISTLGLEGLKAIRQTHPDLVLLDMQLPDIDGLDLLLLLKDHPDTESIPVIAVSADATRERISQALEAGAAHYLTKPVNVTELLAVVDELLEQQDTRFG